EREEYEPHTERAVERECAPVPDRLSIPRELEPPFETVPPERQPAVEERPIDHGEQPVAQDEKQTALKERHQRRPPRVLRDPRRVVFVSPIAHATRKPAAEPIAIDGNQITVHHTPAI